MTIYLIYVSTTGVAGKVWKVVGLQLVDN